MNTTSVADNKNLLVTFILVAISYECDSSSISEKTVKNLFPFQWVRAQITVSRPADFAL